MTNPIKIHSIKLFTTATLLAFALHGYAQAKAPATDDEKDSAEVSPMDGFPGGMPRPSVKKMTDGALTCPQIFAEASTLEKTLADQKKEADLAQKTANDIRDNMMKQAMSGMGGNQGTSMATGLLGMIPGAGMLSGLVGGAVVQSSMEARASSMQDNSSKMLQAQQKAMDAQQDMAYNEGRHEYLVDMFLKKACKIPSQ